MKLYKEKIAIVSLSDHNYFHLIEDLIDSIQRFDESKDISICILDAGMTKEQVIKIKDKVHAVKKAEWDIPVNSLKVKNREWLKSQVCRPFLPNYFPEFDKIIWIDCDAWVNSWTAIDHLVNGSKNDKLAICSMSDRHTGRVLRVNWLFRNIGIIKSQNLKHSLSSGFRTKDCQFIATEPHLNVGVFSLNSKSKIWDVWQKNLKKALKKGRIFGSEQIALNYSVYIDKCEAELLPFYCNWIPFSNTTFWDENKNTFVERYYPHNEIGIMHLAGGIKIEDKDMRYDKGLKIKLKTLSGKFIEKSFRYSVG
jgi:lipopolysaccharide biosynthesis glycosyltransferase